MQPARQFQRHLPQLLRGFVLATTWVLLVLLCGFQIKHYIADYLWQTSLMLAGKGDLGAPGGYLHAGVHVLGSAIVLAIVRTPLAIAVALLAAEFVIHYGLDYLKAVYGRARLEAEPKKYWALHGLDQLLHQLTYVVMIYVALSFA
jgi:hypothetical protein